MRTQIEGIKYEMPDGYYRVTNKLDMARRDDLVWGSCEDLWSKPTGRLDLVGNYYAVIRKGVKPPKVIKENSKPPAYIKVTSIDDIKKYNLKEGSKIIINDLKYTIVKIHSAGNYGWGLLSQQFAICLITSKLELLISAYTLGI